VQLAGERILCILWRRFLYYALLSLHLGEHLHYSTPMPSLTGECLSMLVTQEPFVIPTRWDWVGLLILIGVFGFLAQVITLLLTLSPTL
jgi:hypothetical protein